jgi:murein tripeptide amidase MpaA
MELTGELMATTPFNRYLKYDELTCLLKDLTAQYPALLRMESIGKSHEGREVWLLTVTNFATGVDVEKPGFWVDGNLHASEVAGSMAALYLVHSLVTRYGRDVEVTTALDSRVFYVVPRISPDGAEWALADKPRYIRSSTRPYPYDEEPVDGLLQEDIDGDGRILSMRIPDANGAWKTHPAYPKLMVRRDPVESGGRYYRLLPEGLLRNYDGVTILPKGAKQGLDLNRNFPPAWRQENEQSGAGPYPLSEPETRNLVDFIIRHPNITGAITFHTYSGVLLRPYDDRPDDAFPAEDLWTYKKIGEQGSLLTGYPNISTYHDFRYHPKTVTTGGFDTWMYDHLGTFSWTVEVWNPLHQAGIKNYKFIDWFREHPLSDDLLLMKWDEEKLAGKGYVDWYPFDHPQLGAVELGGWDSMYAWGNPPVKFLKKELQLFPKWILWHALISPHLALREHSLEPIGGKAFRLRLVVENTGWLPTYVTKKALEKKVVRGVICEIELPPGASLKHGKTREEFSQLEGRAYRFAFPEAWEGGTDDRLKVEWVILAPRGGVAKVKAWHERAGIVRLEVNLKA